MNFRSAVLKTAASSGFASAAHPVQGLSAPQVVVVEGRELMYSVHNNVSMMSLANSGSYNLVRVVPHRWGTPLTQQ